MKKRVNSNVKGKRGELEAVKLLKSLGIADAMRTAQFNGKNPHSAGDIVCPESLPNMHFEVKFGVGGMDLGTKLWYKAWEQATTEAKDDQTPVLLWRRSGDKHWRMTFQGMGMLVTVCGKDIKEAIAAL